jgi:hypothetical protein
MSNQEQMRIMPPRYNPKQTPYSPTGQVGSGSASQQQQQSQQQPMSKLVEHLSPDSRARMQQHVHQNAVLMTSPVMVNMNKSVEDLAGKTRSVQRKSTARKDNYQDENMHDGEVFKRIVIDDPKRREADVLKEKVTQFEVISERDELQRYKILNLIKIFYSYFFFFNLFIEGLLTKKLL